MDWYKLMTSKCNFGWQSGMAFTQARPKCPKTRWASLVAHCSNLFSSLLRYLCEFRKTNSFSWKNFEGTMALLDMMGHNNFCKHVLLVLAAHLHLHPSSCRVNECNQSIPIPFLPELPSKLAGESACFSFPVSWCWRCWRFWTLWVSSVRPSSSSSSDPWAPGWWCFLCSWATHRWRKSAGCKPSLAK